MSTALVGAPVVVALIGQLAVAVAAVVVVLAIIAVIVMVLRNNGAARQAAGGLGYDTRRGARDDYDDSYDNAPAPWARQGSQGGSPQPGGAWQNGGGNGYGGPNSGGNGYDRQGDPRGGQPAMGGRNSGANWGQGDQQAAPAWGGPPAASDTPRQWGNQQPAPAMNSMPRGQQAQGQQNPWDAPDAGMPWNDNQGNQGGQGNQGWGQPAAPWGAPPAAAPDQNAWGVAAPTSGGQQNAWGPPVAQPAGPRQNAWGASGAPSGPNWGSPPPMPNTPPTQPWGGPGGGQGSYDAPPPAPPYGGMNGQDRGRAATNLRPGAIMVKEGKEPGRVFEIRGDRLTIGRSRDSDIFLEDLAVSRLHATVYREPTGLYVVRDESSANGTTVNGQRITEQPLEEGDEIGLGQTILTFVRR